MSAKHYLDLPEISTATLDRNRLTDIVTLLIHLGYYHQAVLLLHEFSGWSYTECLEFISARRPGARW